MPYVPPHLRNAGSDAQPSDPSKPAAATARFGGYQRYGNREPPSNNQRDGWSRDDRSFSRSLSRTQSGTIPEPAWPEWKPSARVISLTEEQKAEIRQRLNVTVEGETSSTAPAAIESFDDMNLHTNIMRDIHHREYSNPTPIQCQGIPAGLSGLDILGCAETGSGKTASFCIPMVQHCLNQPPLRPGDGPIAIVLAPTRELAQQIEKEARAFSNTSQGVRTAIVVGGTSIMDQKREMRAGVEVIVATPGRLIDHLQQQNLSLNRVSFVVLDEADRMLDMGFEPQIQEIMKSLSPKRQTLLFSATMPPEIEDLAQSYLRKPLRIKVGKVSTPTANVSQTLVKVEESRKVEQLCQLLLDEQRMAATNAAELPLTVVFVERKARCDEVAAAVQDAGVNAVALHGGLSQGEREGALHSFSTAQARVLIATDVASRGLDIKGIAHVVNMDLPHTFEDYVHRIGRTGRAGTSGRATSFYTDRDAFLVSQIKHALQQLEAGNATAFATGKAARQKEKLLAQQMKTSMKLGQQSVVRQTSGAAVKMDDKYKFMATNSAPAGTADDAWDD